MTEWTGFRHLKLDEMNGFRHPELDSGSKIFKHLRSKQKREEKL
jgi:hypothetical protein